MAITDSLIAYWKLQEASGNRADSYGSETLTDNNTVTQAVGPNAGAVIANAAQFTLANNEWLARADDAALSTGDIDFTICGWVYMDSKTSYRLIASKDNAAAQREWFLDYDSGADRFFFNTFHALGSTNAGAAANNLGSPANATWYFIVAWRDKTANTVNIQVNNGTVDSVAGGTVVPANGTAEFAIGRYGGSLNWDGRIAGVAFWKRVLTAAERTYLYNSGNGHADFVVSEKIFAATSTGTATMVRSVGKVLSATSTGTATLVKSVGKVLSATSTGTATLVKSVGKVLSATSTATATLTKTIGKVLSAISNAVASLTATRVPITPGLAGPTVAATLDTGGTAGPSLATTDTGGDAGPTVSTTPYLGGDAGPTVPHSGPW